MPEALPSQMSEEALDQIIAAYAEAVDGGQALDRAEWLRRYPEAASALEAFFADQDRFDRRVAPLRECVSDSSLLQVVDSFPLAGTRVGDYELLEEIVVANA